MTRLEELADQIVETDFLIIGGGLAGTMAAIRAKWKGNLDVTIVEKANMARSGDATVGLDHYGGVAHPKFNGITAEEFGHMRAAELAGLVSTNLSIATVKNILKPLPILEDIGVKIREEDGSFKSPGGRLTGAGTIATDKASDFIFYRGADLKPKLAAEVRKAGVRIFERTMLTSLITKDDSVVGATALNVRDGRFIVFKSKVVLLATGGVESRVHYTNMFFRYPNSLFMSSAFPGNAGGGHAAAYRAGARLINVELTRVRYAPLGRNPGPQGEKWARMMNSKNENMTAKYAEMRDKMGGIPFSSLPYLPDMARPEWESEVIMNRWEGIVGTPAEVAVDYHGTWSSTNETPYVLKPLMERGGARGAPLELTTYLLGIPHSVSGIRFNEKGETSLRGLFAAGDIQGAVPQFGSSGAFAWGYIIADHVCGLIHQTKKPVFGDEQVQQVEAERQRVLAPLGNTNGVNPLKLEDLVRKIITYYVGVYKSEPKLKRCVEQLQLVRDKLVPVLEASSPHDLMRAVEVRDILDIGEIHARAAILRTESRFPPTHYRVDYPERDDKNWLRKSIVIYNVAGEMRHEIETLD